MGTEGTLPSSQVHNTSTTVKKMSKAVVLACLLAVAVAFPRDSVISVDQDNHQHDQKGIPGKSVTGSYRFIAADGSTHEITYVADERGYRVIGDAKLEEDPNRITTPRPTRPPTRPPTTGYYYPTPSNDYLPPPGKT